MLNLIITLLSKSKPQHGWGLSFMVREWQRFTTVLVHAQLTSKAGIVNNSRYLLMVSLAVTMINSASWSIL